MQYIVHLGYLLQLFALLARDVLWLRSILVVAQSVLAFYAWTQGLWPYVFWNLLFVAINLYWVAVLLRERRAVRLPDDLKPLHAKHFAALSPPEFLRIWQMGVRKTGQDLRLIEQNSKPTALYFLLQGEAVVRQDGRKIAHLNAGSFVGEMSLLTGEVCTADVSALGRIEFMAWPAQQLMQLRGRNAMLWSKVQSVLGHDLVEKIKRTAASTGSPIPAEAPSPAGLPQPASRPE